MKIKRLLNRVLPAVILMAAWAVSMWYVTVAGARELYRDWQAISKQSQQCLCLNETMRILYEGDPASSYMAYLELPLFWSVSTRRANPDNHLEVSHYYLDQEGKSTIQEGRYAVIRYYRVEDSWNGDPQHRCYMDLGAAPGEWEKWLSKNTARAISGEEPKWVKLEGRFEGERFVPVKAQWMYVWYLIPEWNLIFDGSNGEPQPDTLIFSTQEEVNALDAQIRIIDTTTGPVSVGDLSFENCQALAEAWAEPSEALADAYKDYARTSKPTFRELRETVFIQELSDLTAYGALDADDGNFTCCTQIIRCYPLRSAMLQLIPVYLVSLAVVVLTFLLVRRRYTKSILETLNGDREQRTSGNHGWKELAQLEERYQEAAGLLWEQTPELRRLETALRYAGDAEENRRKLVSDMTHELKTPLAVIHSYAEGLSMGIAPEKQEAYLRVIMEEAKKMDAMVLSMLDLSRLEAGRVRLDREPVCLMDMAVAVFEKLKPLYEEKRLSVHFLGDSFDILADRGRMEQMITNLATNAVKYCTPTGSICVKVYQLEDMTWFSMENHCYRLPQKALDQIWDSFFREDSAQDTKGTGLGLPIVKSIVELHGGSCRAVNTDSGLEFQIRLPH